MKTTAFGWAMTALVGLGGVGCGGADESEPTWESKPPTTEDRYVATIAKGTYELTTTIDVNALAIAPQTVVDTVGLVRDLNENPGGALFAHSDRIGVPAVKTLHDALPGVLTDHLDEMMTDAIFGSRSEGRPYRDEMGSLVGLMDATLFRFDVTSELELSSSEPEGVAKHSFRGVSFGGAGGTIPLRIAAFTDAAGVTQASPTFRIGAATNGVSTLVLGDHAFGLPIGDYAYAALDAISVNRYRVGFRAGLNRMIQCDAIAHVVASQCIDLPGPLPEVCVGHEPELREVCNRGLDEVDARIHAKLREMNVDVLRYERGVATLRYESGAALGLEAGTWEAQINLSQGLRHVRTEFRGARR